MNSDATPLVLVVDDNEENIKVLGSLLRMNGYEVAASTSGAKIFNFLEKRLPDLILLDIMMPEMDGYQVCEMLKGGGANIRNIPVIFLTAKTETDDLVRGFDLGGADYVTKPFQPAELLARIRTHIALKRARDEISAFRGIIPICAQCKKIRDDDAGVWERLEKYIEEHSDAMFTHSLCPRCADEFRANM